MRAPNDPNFRVIMTQPARADCFFKKNRKHLCYEKSYAGGYFCKSAIGHLATFLAKIMGCNKVLAELSMYCIDTNAGIARMEASNDDFLISAKDMETLEKFQKPLLEAWKIPFTTLTHDEALVKYSSKPESGPTNTFQHVGLKIDL